MINEVRQNPHSIIQPLEEQMNFIDEDNILDKPDRDPIQLEEGKSAVSDTLLIESKGFKTFC